MAAPQTDPVPLPEMWDNPEHIEPRIWNLRISGPSLGDYSFNEGVAYTCQEAARQVHSDACTVTFSITATGAEARHLFARLASARLGDS